MIIQQDSAAAMVKSKKKEDTAEGTIKNWIAIFGAPESYFIRKCVLVFVCVCVWGGGGWRGGVNVITSFVDSLILL